MGTDNPAALDLFIQNKLLDSITKVQCIYHRALHTNFLSLNSSFLSEDLEGYYCKQLLEAKRANQSKEQIFYLEKLSDLYLQKQNWIQAAKILNSAFAILEKSGEHSDFQNYLLAKLERIEALYLEKKGYKIPSEHRGRILKYREIFMNLNPI